MHRRVKSFSTYLSKFVSDERIEAYAQSSGFKRRKSVISPKSFLDTVFFCSGQKSPSLTEYSIDLAHHSGVEVSKQALDKRFNGNTKVMLTNLLQEVLSQQVCIPSEQSSSNWFTDIHVMDSSEFAVSRKVASTFPGYGGPGREALVQVQFEYQLLGSKVTTLTIGSALDSDSVEGMRHLDKIPAKTLLLRDLGYFSPKAFKELTSRDLYFISRAKSQWNFYIRQGDRFILLTTAHILDKLKSQKDKYIDLDIYVGKQARTPVRLIASLLTEEQRKNRLKRKSANRKLGADAMESMELNLFVTNVEREKCMASQIYDLYTLRWQIELIFKTWKSVMRLHAIHPMNATRLECIILIKLLWVMLNWSILNQLKGNTHHNVSFHKLTHTLQSRSKMLTISILQNRDRLFEWLMDLYWISLVHHQKENKKGRKKVSEILLSTYNQIA